jgi:hypothetical protein
MKKILLIILLSILSSSVLARTAWVDNKTICEKTKGTWRIFNNDCANSCESKFSLPLCSSTSIYSCDCGKNRCWDNDKCISDKVAKAYWDEIADKNAEDREEELKILKEQQELFYSELKNKKTTPTSPTSQVQATTQPIAVETPAVPAIGNDPEVEKSNNEQKQLCERQKGFWKQFSNGCVDNCISKISKMSMCTMSLTFGCYCGETKCWNESQNSCIEIEDYKKLTSQTTADSKPNSPIVIEQPNNPLSLNPVDLNSGSKVDNSKNTNSPNQQK